MHPHRLIHFLFRLVPLDADGKERLKASIYDRFGHLFRWSPNYRQWRRKQVTERRLDAPEAPSEAQWDALVARRSDPAPVASGEGRPYVVVPVYKGREETLACLYSVLDADPQTDLEVIDDASPDATLAAELRALADRGLFVLHRNPHNLGFALTVNRGMALHEDRDVVLLNSDTCVYGDWLERLRRAAHAGGPGGGRVGTVTPLTNNGELASYPRWLEDNTTRLELSHAELDAMAAEVNAGMVVEVPTGVGFCLYVRRSCLEAVGLFDERFAAGYGEENEFCLRAAAAGWPSVVAGDVFVTHFGSVSFGRGRAKRRKMERALELLEDAHPDYQRDIQRFIAHDPLAAARLRLDAARIRRAARHARPRRTVLMVTHTWGGGVAEHVDRMTRALEAEGVNVFRLEPFVDGTVPAVTLRGPRLRSRRPSLPNAERIAMNANRDDLVDGLRILEVDHVHVQHAGGFGVFATEWLRHLPRALGCSYDLTLHDYAPVCPRLHFNLPDGRYCGEPPVAECERCVSINGSPNGYHPMWHWRPSWEPLLEGARQVFCPSGDVAQRMARYFPKAHYCVRPHPERLSRETFTGPRAVRGEGEPLRVAVPGAIGEQKGFEVLVACAEDARKRRLPLAFTVVGYTMSDARAEAAGIEVTGRYAPGDTERVLAAARCDLAFLPSTTPETYCFTLSSVFRVGLFPVVFDLGALAERVRDAAFGAVLPVDLFDEAEAINDRLLALDVEIAPEDLGQRTAGGTYPSMLADYYGLDCGLDRGPAAADDERRTP